MIRFWTYKDLDHLELLHAAYKKQVFSPHFHEGHVIGVIESGCLGFDYRGEKVLASKGQINIADPGEVHNGFAACESGWQYRMFYLAPGQLDRICSDMCDGIAPMPFFKAGVLRDPGFARALIRLHRDFEDPRIDLLEKESRFQLLMAAFAMKHSKTKPVACRQGKEPDLVKRIKLYIRRFYARDIRLPDLSRISGFSRYYLLRAFTKQTGMTPHAFLSFVRSAKAKQMLDTRIPIADAAQATGFYDQSHLNRVFKKIYGITPGRYTKALS